MSGARAAAKKKPQSSPSSTSPKKRKTLDTQNPKSSNSSLVEKVQENGKQSITDGLKPSSDEPKKIEGPIGAKSALEPVDSSKQRQKKAKIVGLKETIAELKGKMVLLKKKAGDFEPKMVACWGRGERVPFIFLCLAFDLISNETGRIVITDIVCNMLRTVIDTTPEDLLPFLYLAANKIAPAHEGLELGIGDASIIKALAEAFGRTEAQVKKLYKVNLLRRVCLFWLSCSYIIVFFMFLILCSCLQDMGDLGLVAKASRSSQSMMRKPDPLTIVKVFDSFRLIAKVLFSNLFLTEIITFVLELR